MILKMMSITSLIFQALFHILSETQRLPETLYRNCIEKWKSIFYCLCKSGVLNPFGPMSYYPLFRYLLGSHQMRCRLLVLTCGIFGPHAAPSRGMSSSLDRYLQAFPLLKMYNFCTSYQCQII